MTDLEGMDVVFTETGETRRVTGWCKVCYPEGGYPHDPVIVSKSGICHESEGYGVTDCGKDATGPNWWWAE